ncbi:MAG: DUF1015 domain-containing protein [Actinomycetota bacterium]|nr:DUF1015 domain-containing protein [Actinomycetota bacterium]
MPHVFPFRAIRYRPGSELASVTAPPYDVIPPDEATRLERSHPHNIVRITLGREQADGEGGDRYSRAAGYLRKWLSSGVLVQDASPRIYLYRVDYVIEGSRHATAGLIGALNLEPLGEGDVFPHERTTSGPKADRLALMRQTKANLEPLWFFASAPIGGFRDLIATASRQHPLADLWDSRGIRHRLWSFPQQDAAPVTNALSAIPLVIADGHHRYETALDYMRERRELDGPGPWDAVLAMISDPESFAPQVLPIHRLAKGVSLSDLPNLDPFEGDIRALARAVRSSPERVIGVATIDGAWLMPSRGPLDTAFLADAVFGPVQAEVVYAHDLEEVEKGISDGHLAFITAPVPLDLIAQMALDGQRMPPKTTLFWPKPRSGLVMRSLEE